MKKLLISVAALGLCVISTPTVAQEVPLIPGEYWEVAEIDVLDGQFSNYADYLAGRWRTNQEFAKSKGWIKDYHIFGTVNSRADEPDLYLVTVYDRQPTAAEQMAREKEFDAFLQTNARKEDAAFAARGPMRKVGGSMLMQRLLFRK